MKRFSFLARGSVFDLALAGFAGAALLFAAFWLPEWRLTQIALASGLADIFPPAQPPLGFTARVAFAAAVGIVVFGGSLLLLKLADRPRVKRRAFTEADAPPEPIRLRRADAHPDAPARRPLVARDLGEPDETPGEELLLAPEAKVPAFLVEQEPETVEAEPVDESAEPEAPLVWPEPVRAPEPEPVRAPEPEPVSASEPEPLVAEALPPAPVEPVIVEAVEHEPVAEEPVPAEEPAPAQDPDASLSKLMQRLEFGLGRKERVTLNPAAVAPQADDAVGHRLRSAIGDLQKLAARG
ncbi:MAG TPA: hypothetical protein VGB65_10820 [Allosphingosinicella sp.]|jgi:hypothetical protein